MPSGCATVASVERARRFRALYEKDLVRTISYFCRPWHRSARDAGIADVKEGLRASSALRERER